MATLREGANEFNGQGKQAELPLTALYERIKQFEHGPPSGPVDPASQIHCEMDVLPGAAVENAGQSLHIFELKY